MSAPIAFSNGILFLNFLFKYANKNSLADNNGSQGIRALSFLFAGLPVKIMKVSCCLSRITLQKTP